MSKREIAAAAAKKYFPSPDNATANPPADRYHSVIALITLGKAEEGENINREKFLQAILTEFFLEYPIDVSGGAAAAQRATANAARCICFAPTLLACTEQEQQEGIREYSYLLVVEDLNLLDVVLREDGSGPADRAEVEAAMRLARLGHLG